VPALSPSLAQAVLLETGVWMLAAMITAMRHALDYSSTARSISVCVIGWIVHGFILPIVFNVFGGMLGSMLEKKPL
jgi:hypothetical protein